MSDQASALLAMNDQLRRMTAQLEHMSVASAAVNRSFEQLSDLGQKVVHSHFLLDAVARPGRGGGTGRPAGGVASLDEAAVGAGGAAKIWVTTGTLNIASAQVWAGGRGPRGGGGSGGGGFSPPPPDRDPGDEAQRTRAYYEAKGGGGSAGWGAGVAAGNLLTAAAVTSVLMLVDQASRRLRLGGAAGNLLGHHPVVSPHSTVVGRATRPATLFDVATPEERSQYEGHHSGDARLSAAEYKRLYDRLRARARRAGPVDEPVFGAHAGATASDAVDPALLVHGRPRTAAGPNWEYPALPHRVSARTAGGEAWFDTPPVWKDPNEPYDAQDNALGRDVLRGMRVGGGRMTRQAWSSLSEDERDLVAGLVRGHAARRRGTGLPLGDVPLYGGPVNVPVRVVGPYVPPPETPLLMGPGDQRGWQGAHQGHVPNWQTRDDPASDRRAWEPDYRRWDRARGVDGSPFGAGGGPMLLEDRRGRWSKAKGWAGGAIQKGRDLWETHAPDAAGLKRFEEALTEASKKVLMFGTSAASSAAPDAMETLAGSFKLLAATVGTTLLPTVVGWSRSLQDAARWFQGLSPGAKGMVGTVGGWAMTGAAGVVGLRAAGVSPGTAVTYGGAAMVMAGRAAAAHPVAAAGVAAATGAAALSLWGDGEGSPDMQWRSPSAEFLGMTWHEPISSHLARKLNRMEREAYYRDRDGDGAFVDASGAGDVRKSSRYQEYVKRGAAALETDLNKARGLRSANAAQAETALKQGDLDQYASKKSLSGRAGADVRELLSIRELRQIEEMPDGPERRARMSKFEESLPKGGSLARKREDAKLLEAAPLLLAFTQHTPPGYFSPEDLHKKMQLQALGESPLQAEIRRIQQAQLDQMLEMSPRVKQIADKMGYVPLPPSQGGP